MAAMRDILESVRSRVASVRAHPALNRLARRELASDRAGRHPVDPDHRPHLLEAVAWLGRAQDATGTGGVARGYSLAYSAYFRSRGWQPPYPETTGYIIPTLLEAGRVLRDPALTERAIRAAHWEADLQLDSGAVQGGVVGEGRSPAVFNTGQVILGWLAADQETPEPRFREAARRASQWLVEVQESDGLWRKGNSQFALGEPTLYNARVAWALAEAGAWLGETGFTEAARRNLGEVARQVAANGWIPSCCLTDPSAPLLHTLAYTVRGLIEGGRVLSDAGVLDAGARTARALLARVEPDGRMSGRFDQDWRGTVSWSCLTGQVQMANNWMRLTAITGDQSWLQPVGRVLAFVKSTQNRATRDPGLRGGIKGSWPLDGDYGRYELLNWATKYFVDALIRAGRSGPADDPFRLA